MVGIRDAKLSQKFQMDAELNLEKATKLVKESEAIKLQQTTLHPDNTIDVGAVNRRPYRRQGQFKQPHKQNPHSYLLPALDVVKHLTAECNVQQEIKSTINATRRDTFKNFAEAVKQCSKELEKLERTLMMTLWEQYMQTLKP